MSLAVDVSAIADLLVATDRGPWVTEQIDGHDLFAPELIVAEVVSVLRGWVRSGELTAERGAAALDDLADLDIDLHTMPPLVPAAWAWRDNLSAYEAMYVALAADFELALLTTDERLGRAAEALGVSVIRPG